MRDLGKAVDGLLEARVVAVHEDEDVPRRRLREPRVERRARLVEGHRLGAQRDEILGGIAGPRTRPLHFADLALRIGRDRNVDVGEMQPERTLAAKHHAGLDDGRARGRDQHVDMGGARRPRRNLDQVAFGTPAAARQQERQREGRQKPARGSTPFGSAKV